MSAPARIALIGHGEQLADRLAARGVGCLCLPVRHADAVPDGIPVHAPAAVVARLGLRPAAPTATALVELSMAGRHLAGGAVVVTDAATASAAAVPVRLLASPVHGIDAEFTSRPRLRRRAGDLEPDELILLATAPRPQVSRHRVFVAHDAVAAVSGSKDRAAVRRFAADVIALMPAPMPAGWCMDIARADNGSLLVSALRPSFCTDPLDADPVGFAASVAACYENGQEQFAWVPRPRLEV